MGRKQNNNAALKRPEGIQIRRGSSGKTSLRLLFYYKGVFCRETLKLEATASNLKYAERLRVEVLNNIERGTFNYRHFFPDSKRANLFCNDDNTTVGEMLTEYLDEIKKSLRNSTYLGYKRKAEKHLFPTFGDLPIRMLNAAMIRKWIKGLSLTSKTVRDILVPLRAVIRTAMVDEILEKNPLEYIAVNQLLDRKTRKSKYVVDPFSKDEINAILNIADGQLKNLLQFAFFTGLRTSELIALEWGDIDWIHQQIYVTRTVVEGVEEDETKTLSSRRRVLLLPPALEALEAQKAYTFLAGKRIFHDPLDNQPWVWAWKIRERWKPILRQAKVRYRNPYQARHTYASMLLSKGENMMWVAKQMGHKNTQMLMRIYAQWIPDDSVVGGYRLQNNWGEYLGESEMNDPKLIPKKYGT